jgi:Flp pilus assembly pilin Flp
MVPARRRRRRTQPQDRQAGQGLVEYGLILSLIALIAIASLTFIGTALTGYLSMIGSSI